MNGRSTAFFQGCCTGIDSRTRRHNIIDQQNPTVRQSFGSFVFKSTVNVTKPFSGCQICLRGRWPDPADQARPHGEAQETAEFTGQQA